MNVADMLADSDYADIESESGRARSLPRATRHRRGRSRMRGDHGSPASILPRKRRRAGTRQTANESDHDLEDREEDMQGAETQMEQIRYDQIHLWYYRVFQSLKQLCCRDILRAWIRHAHPNKQTKFPYNGGKDQAKIVESERIFDYPGHFTMPDYWLDDRDWQKHIGVRHKEPDHLDKHGQSVR